jgi:hypothetical protein
VAKSLAKSLAKSFAKSSGKSLAKTLDYVIFSQKLPFFTICLPYNCQAVAFFMLLH